MAGGKENARQKMINLMYLVFIAMLALNMSKEVLMTFGEIEREVSKSSKSLQASNKVALSVMQSSAKNDSIVWYAPYETVNRIAVATDELVEFINKKGNDLITASDDNPDQIFKRPVKIKENDYGRTINGSIPETLGDYERMDNSQAYDEVLFMNGTEDGYTDAGREFVRLVNNFRDVATDAINNSNIGSNDTIIKKRWDESTSSLRNLVESSFNTDPVKVGKGEDKVKSWLHFNFEGFPEIASTTKITLLEEDALNVVKTLVSTVNEIILGENLSSLRAIVSNVNVFYENSKLEGSVALGKYDETFVASKVKIKNGNGPMKEYRAIDVMENGEVVLEKLNLNVGGPGAKKLTGEIVFVRTEKGEDVEKTIPIDHEYFVNPPLAIVNNPDMNVVYQDIENKLNITMPGVANENIQIMSPSTIRQSTRAGEYIMEKERGTNGKVRIIIKDKVSGIVSPAVVFDVVKLPTPIADFSEDGNTLAKQAISSGTLVGSFNNPRLDASLKLNVAEFKVKVGARNLGVVRGTRGAFNQRVKSEIMRAGRGTDIKIFDIRYNSAKIDNGARFLTADNQVVLTVR
tara:strand:- start:884 stop:2611 length:1728 start_codon:yes stop_codon:yes gene_type:complete